MLINIPIRKQNGKFKVSVADEFGVEHIRVFKTKQGAKQHAAKHKGVVLEQIQAKTTSKGLRRV